ncbi:aminotransferase class V-fold PLP-dependent enzyme [Helicovermis profundi]|uniref:cysteine desulfurase n=1 Tax=Helicovermis profundi TaxID=3065157 RepID=A0AAU9EEC6_9FIRM|nr:aminotransferase class V-fold PLP-dependent enzyme [Clostridia bacterium S502]
MNKKRIYLDNGATSFPKAPGVAESMYNYLVNNGASVGRGSYEETLDAQRVIFETRELICKLFNFDKVENVVFTKNITESLNTIIKGLLTDNDHVIISSMEHNAVMRPLNSLELKGIDITRVMCNKYGEIDPSDVRDAIKANTKAIIMIHSSNVCGTVLDLEEIGKIAKENNIFFIVDAAQTAGFLDVDFIKLNASVIAFTGHKSLLGPQGTGGFIVSDEICKQINPFIEGGTGSASEDENQPKYMPDKFESGTPNVVGLYGLNASLKFIFETGLENIRNHELKITKMFIEGLNNIKGIKIIGKLETEGRTPVVSVDFLENDNALVSYMLEKSYGISTRVGMHCAPSAHKTLGTFPSGTVRFSFSYFNTEDEIDYTLNSIKEVLRKVD